MRLPATSRLVMRGEVGIPRSDVDPAQYVNLRRALLRNKVEFDGSSRPVTALRDDDPDYLWVPRFFQREDLWPLVQKWEWTEGRHYDFQVAAKLDPERGQDVTVPAMIDYLKAHSGGLLVSPTGTGKTLCGYAVAAAFKRFIGVPIYVGHMLDNWREHAKTVLGLTDDQIGLVQGDRCDLGRPVTLMMVQSLLTRRYPDELYDQIGFVVGDEIHRYGAEVWKNMIAQFPAKYRLGLSANPNRKDSLADFIPWSFGSVGHKARRIRNEAVAPPTVVVIRTDRTYPEGKYSTWAHGKFGGAPSSVKYDKCLATDPARNAILTAEIVKAARSGRSIIVLSSLTAHLQLLKNMAEKELAAEELVLDTLEAGLKPERRAQVAEADVIFATFAMAREALNVPKLDTAFFATPPGDPLQPVGRLREKAEGLDRKPLLVVDCCEEVPYAKKKLDKRRTAYSTLGIGVSEVVRRSK